MTEESGKAALTVQIVSAYVNSNKLDAGELPAFIKSIAGAFGSLNAPQEAPALIVKPSRAQIQRSIRPDALVSFEDGKSYRGLKRHLTKLAMSPDNYRAKWGLPADYPMVCADYSAVRSSMAKVAGLGRKRVADVEVSTPKAPAARTKGKLGLFSSKKAG